MKTQIKPAFVVPIAALAVALLVFVGYRAVSTPEIDVKPKKLPGYIEGIPDYVKQGRAPTAAERPSGVGAPPPGAVPTVPGTR